MTRRFVLATANVDKAVELRQILTEVLGDVELLERPDSVPEIEESGVTLEENARLKAVALVTATGMAAIADDTGLEVSALGGAPGVFAARYAGKGATYWDNVKKLIAELEGVNPPDRGARFRTVAVACFPDGSAISASGAVEGQIATEPRGDGGFGYDPVFVPDGSGGLTFAEMRPADKHAVSHRGRAFRALAAALSSGGTQLADMA